MKIKIFNIHQKELWTVEKVHDNSFYSLSSLLMKAKIASHVGRYRKLYVASVVKM